MTHKEDQQAFREAKRLKKESRLREEEARRKMLLYRRVEIETSQLIPLLASQGLIPIDTVEIKTLGHSPESVVFSILRAV